MIQRPRLFDRPRNVHLVGAGGIGVSALAQALMHRGHHVSGSDAQDSDRIGKLRSLGALMRVGHNGENLPPETELVVASAACAPANPEIHEAAARGLTVVKYANALGDLMAEECGIAVAGCHGKTTTTGLLATVLVRGGLDPTMVLGGEAGPLGGNFRPGDGRYFIAEACEFDRSFLSLAPTIGIVTNIDADHLDYYRDLDDISGAFREFARLLPANGYLATLNEHERVFRDAARCQVETFGLRAHADWVATECSQSGPHTRFRVLHEGRDQGVFELRLSGLHNVLNTLGVIAVSHHLGLDFDTAVRPALRDYSGVDRRMQVRYEGHDVIVLDDYAHHPNEVAAVLGTLRDEYPGRRIVAVLQCHQASRTRRHLRSYAEALKLADRVLVPDIFLARDSEEERRAVHAVDLVQAALNRGVNASYVASLKGCSESLLREIRSGDLVVTMGAGSITEVSRDFAEHLRAFDSQVIAPR